MPTIWLCALVFAGCEKGPSPKWTYRAEAGRVSAVAVDAGRVAFGTESGLHLVDATGEKLCVQRELGGIAATPAVSFDRIWVATVDAEVLALDWTCAIQWRIPLTGRVTGGLTRVGNRVLVASHAGRLKSIDAESGKVQWHYPSLEQPALRPLAQAAPLVVGELVWVGRREGGVVGVDLESGKVRFDVTLGPVTGGLLVSEGRVWVAEDTGRLSAINAESGEVERRIELDLRLGSAPITVNDSIVLGTRDRKVVAIDPERGEIRWSYTTRGPVEVPPVFFASRLIAAGGSGDGGLYAIDAKSGKGERMFGAGERIASALVAEGGVLFVTSEAGSIYAFDALPELKR